jgi:8-oxo-dGTP pyrophosphatase MutT (NUDIX family)
VVVRQSGGSVQVLLGEQRDRLSAKHNTRLPKGIVEPDETPELAALREVKEETGLVSRVVAPLETVDYTYQEQGALVAKQVHFFLMELADTEPGPRDGELARVYWCPIETAAERLSFETERRVVRLARERLGV